MPSLLVLNPAPKRRRKSAKRKTRRVVRAANPAPRRARRRVRRNPITVAGVRRAARRHLGRARRVIRSRRRRNPISMRSFSASNIMGMLKGAAVGGVGAVGMDFVWDKINGYLPASMQITAGSVGVGEAAKIAATMLVGRLGNKATKGLSEKMATGSLVVQMYQITQKLAAQYAPTMLPSGVAGVGFAVPNPVSRNSPRLNFRPIRQGVGAFNPRGSGTPLLSGVGAFNPRGSGSPLLSGDVAAREGVKYR